MTSLANNVERYGAAAGLTLAGLTVALLFERVRGLLDDARLGCGCADRALLRFLPSLFASALSIVAIDFDAAAVGKTRVHPSGRDRLSRGVRRLSLVISGYASLRVAQASAERIASRATRLLDVTKALAEASLCRRRSRDDRSRPRGRGACRV
jgi:hypothetical protein